MSKFKMLTKKVKVTLDSATLIEIPLVNNWPLGWLEWLGDQSDHSWTYLSSHFLCNPPPPPPLALLFPWWLAQGTTPDCHQPSPPSSHLCQCTQLQEKYINHGLRGVHSRNSWASGYQCTHHKGTLGSRCRWFVFKLCRHITTCTINFRTKFLRRYGINSWLCLTT